MDEILTLTLRMRWVILHAPLIIATALPEGPGGEVAAVHRKTDQEAVQSSYEAREVATQSGFSADEIVARCQRQRGSGEARRT